MLLSTISSEIVSFCWPVFSTVTGHLTGLLPSNVLSVEPEVRATPNNAFPEPSPAVVVTVTSACAGDEGVSPGAELAIPVTVVSQSPSAPEATCTLKSVVSELPDSITPGIC